MSEPRRLPRRVPDDAVLSSQRHPSAHRDGRLERRRRNRHAVLDAYLELTGQGVTDPTMEQLAELAGVSHRSVFRYFDDRPALLRAVADHLLERLEPTLFVEPAPALPFDRRVERFIAARLAAHDELGTTAARVFARCDDALPGSLTEVRTRLREDLARHFAAELTEDDDGVMLDVAVTPFHFESLELLSASAGGSSESLSAVLSRHLHLVLGPR